MPFGFAVKYAGTAAGTLISVIAKVCAKTILFNIASGDGIAVTGLSLPDGDREHCYIFNISREQSCLPLNPFPRRKSAG